MIDPTTQHILHKLGQEASAIQKKHTRRVRPMEAEKKQMEWTLKKLEAGGRDGADANTNVAAAAKIREMLASGMYDKEEDILSPEGERALERFWQQKIAALVKTGVISLVDVENDPLMRKIKKRKHA